MAKKKPRAWKLVAFAVVAIFILMIVVGLFRFYRYTGPPATQEQIAAAEKIVAQDLEAKGLPLQDFHIDVSEKTRHIRKGETNHITIRVNANSETERHFYLIDVETGKIVLHSVTAYADWMADSNRLEGRAVYASRSH